ncbi:hypothetical protein B0O80DRAFT_434536 [Mortierella sp. GBAus27b]|nr:hypothetical protein B0O80DRAFT_434536 [Mortierella sp. GBAus27b]
MLMLLVGVGAARIHRSEICLFLLLLHCAVVVPRLPCYCLLPSLSVVVVVLAFCPPCLFIFHTSFFSSSSHSSFPPTIPFVLSLLLACLLPLLSACLHLNSLPPPPSTPDLSCMHTA